MATAVKEDTFTSEVLQSDKPVIVDFWAEWCGPCHAVAPVLDKIVEERGLAERYGIASIPTMILFKDGEPAQVAVGAQPKGALERSLGLAAE